jgi:hypothetical protein
MSSVKSADIVGNGQGGIGQAVDSTSGVLRVEEQSQPRFDDLVNPILVEETNLAVGTYYYPDSDGVCTLGYNNTIAFSGELVSGSATETLTLTIEETNGTEWQDTTGQYLDATGAQPTPGPSIIATNAIVPFGLSRDHVPWGRYRIKIVVTGTVVTNSADVEALAKAQ